MRCRAVWPPARARCSWWMPPRASRRRRLPTSTWRSRPTSNDHPRHQQNRSAKRRAGESRPGARGCDRHCPSDEVVLASAKEGIGTKEILEAIVKHVPPPRGSSGNRLRALVFDSKYDAYKGVIAYVASWMGQSRAADRILMMQTREHD